MCLLQINNHKQLLTCSLADHLICGCVSSYLRERVDDGDERRMKSRGKMMEGDWRRHKVWRLEVRWASWGEGHKNTFIAAFRHMHPCPTYLWCLIPKSLFWEEGFVKTWRKHGQSINNCTLSDFLQTFSTPETSLLALCNTLKDMFETFRSFSLNIIIMEQQVVTKFLWWHKFYFLITLFCSNHVNKDKKEYFS